MNHTVKFAAHKAVKQTVKQLENRSKILQFMSLCQAALAERFGYMVGVFVAQIARFMPHKRM